MNIPQGVKIHNYEIVVSERCNFKCKYCFNQEHSESSTIDKLNSASIPDIINFIDKTHDSSFCINYMGGEPMLNMQFIIDLTDQLNDKFAPSVGFTINTNLSILTEEHINFFADNIFKVEISLDGKKETHNRNRQDWKKVATNLVSLNAKYVDRFGKGHNNIDIIYVVNDDIQHIYDNYSFLSKLAFKVGTYINFKKKWLNEEIDEIIKELYRINPHKNPAIGCKISPRKDVTIDVDGRLYWCSRMMYDHLSYGDIKSGYTNMEVFEKMLDLSINKNNICKSCPTLDFCNKPCIAVHYEEAQDFDHVNQTYCKIKKQFAKGANNE